MAKTLVKPLYYDSSHKEHDTIPSGSYVDVSVIPVSDDSANVLTAESDGLSVTVADLVSEESDNLIKVQDGKLKVDPVDVEVVVSDLISTDEDNLIKVQDGKLIVDSDDIEDLVSDNVTVVSADKGNLITTGTDGGALLTTGNILSTSDVNLITTDSDGKLLVSEENIGLPIHEAMADYIKEVNVNETTVTFIHGDGTTTTIDTQDNKVLQTVTTTSSSYPLLMTATAGQTSTTTSTSRFSTKISANPSTGTITATTFNGAVSGTASSATSDAEGNAITSYVKSIDTSGATITVTQGDGTTYKKTIDISSLIQSGGGISTDSDGKLYVDFEQMTSEQLSELISEIVQDGGGLSVDENGQIYVDFDSMPTDKFEAMLKSIRVPIWLSANKNFYVNGETGSDDTSIEGIGESASKPFKTIQACVDYVTDNYNVSRYVATINIAEGEYNEATISLGSYSGTTGYIRLLGATPDEDGFKTWITGTDAILVDLSLAVRYDLDNLGFRLTVSPACSQFMGCMRVKGGGGVYLNCFYVQVVASDDLAEGMSKSLYLRILNISGGSMYIENYGAVQSVIEVSGFDDITGYTSFEALLDVQSGGYMQTLGASSSELATILASGSIGTSPFCRSNNSKFEVNTAYAHPINFQDNGVTGKRYSAISGGSINVYPDSETYFPGTIDGTVETSTYSWYK